MTAVRARLATVAVLTGAVGVAIVVSSGPAYAAGSLNAPSGTVTSANPVTVTATGGSCGGSLSVTGPGFSRSDSTASDGGSMSVTIDPSSELNGSYQATLTTKTKPIIGSCTTDGSQPTKSFAIEAPAAAPAGVSAQLTGSRQITVSWHQNSEPDVKKYLLYNASSGAALTSIPATDSRFCSSSACSIAVSYPTSTYGQQSFQVTALRADGNGGYAAESNKSSSASATLPPPPSPSPNPSGGGTGGSGGGPGSGGGTGGGSGGQGTGGSTSGGGAGGGATGSGATTGGSSGGIGLGSGVRPGLTFSATSGNVLLPPAPPPAIAAPGGELSPVIGGVPDGPYKDTLPYGAHAVPSQSTHRNAASRVFHDVSNAFNGARLARSIAIAFLLLLAGAHVRMWARRPVV